MFSHNSFERVGKLFYFPGSVVESNPSTNQEDWIINNMQNTLTGSSRIEISRSHPHEPSFPMG
jgi:hypothetical protein